MHPARQNRQRTELAVGESSGLGRNLEGNGSDARRGGECEQDGGAASRFRGERQRRYGRGQAESGSEVLVGDRVEDLERHGAGQARFSSVIDHDPELGPVPLAEEARQVGTDHELFDRAGLLLEAAAHEVAGDAVDKHAPAGDGVGYGEFHGCVAVGTGEQMRLPEGRLVELGAERSRFRGSGFRAGFGLFIFRRSPVRRDLAQSLLLRRFLARGRRRCDLSPHPSHNSADNAEPTAARPADSIPVECREVVRPEGLVRGD